MCQIIFKGKLPWFNNELCHYVFSVHFSIADFDTFTIIVDWINPISTMMHYARRSWLFNKYKRTKESLFFSRNFWNMLCWGYQRNRMEIRYFQGLWTSFMTCLWWTIDTNLLNVELQPNTGFNASSFEIYVYVNSAVMTISLVGIDNSYLF